MPIIYLYYSQHSYNIPLLRTYNIPLLRTCTTDDNMPIIYLYYAHACTSSKQAFGCVYYSSTVYLLLQHFSSISSISQSFTNRDLMTHTHTWISWNTSIKLQSVFFRFFFTLQTRHTAHTVHSTQL